MDNLKVDESNKRCFESITSASDEVPESDKSKNSHSNVTDVEKVDIDRMSDLFLNRSSYDYGYQDFQYLAKNENKRYAENSRHIAHAVIYEDDAGQKLAMQYQMPQGNAELTPVVSPVTDIQQIWRGGAVHYQARSAEGALFYSKRSEQVEVKVDAKGSYQAEVIYLSEDEFEDEEATEVEIWGSAIKIPRFADLSLTQITPHKRTKGGHELLLDSASVLARDRDPNRGISQNKIMGMRLPQEKPSRPGKSVEVSARDDYQFVHEIYGAYLSPKLNEILKKAFTADINQTPDNQYRPEWLHAYGFSLYLISQNPQVKENLGASAKWVNTEMMILERIAKWFALNEVGCTQVSITTLYEMFESSEIIDTIHFETKVALEEKYIRFIQKLDSFKEFPVFRKASDVAQSTGIAQALLHGKAPLSVSSVSISHSLFNDGSYPRKLFRQVPEVITPKTSAQAKQYTAVIIDIETTGLDSKKGKIIEIGMLSVSFTPSEGILSLKGGYNALNDPKEALSDVVKKVTHITDEQLNGQSIDWLCVESLINDADYIICHNSNFDRRYLEAQTPPHIQNIIKTKPFGCSLQDINWRARGLELRNLKYLNDKVGFKFEGHRAINDCWATLNILQEYPGALAELIDNIHLDKSTLCVFGNLFSKNEQLRAKNFAFIDYSEHLPAEFEDTRTLNLKFNYLYTCAEQLDDNKAFIERIGEGKVTAVRQVDNVSAVDRYSQRDGMFDIALACMPAPKLPRKKWSAAKKAPLPNRYTVVDGMLKVLMPYVELAPINARKSEADNSSQAATSSLAKGIGP